MLLTIYQLVIVFLMVKKPTPIYSYDYDVLLVLLIVLVIVLLEKTVKLTTYFQFKLTTSFGAN